MKKAVKAGAALKGAAKGQDEKGGPKATEEGTFRASFEDKLLLSDIVFLRGWVRVDIPRYYNPVTSPAARQRGKVDRHAHRGAAATRALHSHPGQPGFHL